MGNLMGFFPTPFPDETLHSILSRYCRLGGWKSFSVLRRNPSGTTHFARASAFPCGVKELVEIIGLDTYFSAESLIENHTLTPYYRPFLSDTQLTYAMKQMVHGPADALEMRLGLVASMLSRFQRVRYCEACMQADDAVFGQPYWHCVHQLPGVWVCPCHAKVLTVVDIRWSRHHLGTPFLPDDSDVRNHSLDVRPDPLMMPEMFNLAVLSETLLRSRLSPSKPQELRQVFLSSCVDNFFCENSRLKIKPLANAISDYFHLLPNTGEFALLSSSDRGTAPSWVTKLLRKPRGSHHPLKYLLLMRILGLECDRLSSICRPITVVAPQEAHAPGTGHSSHGLILPKKPLSLRQLARLTGVAIDTAKTAALLQGRAIRQFPRVMTPKLVADVHQMAEAGAKAVAIASALSISLASVYRAIRCAPDVQLQRSTSRFFQERARRRESFLAEINTMLPRRCTGYMWLYRNDRYWVSAVIKGNRTARSPIRSRVDWMRRDERLKVLIVECAASLGSQPGKPIRITAAVIGRELSSTDDFEKHLHHLPESSRALSMVCETAQSFMRRRLRWAIDDALMRRSSLAPSRLQRFIGLKTRTPEFDEIRLELLAEHIGK